MIKYVEHRIVFQEVPDEVSLAFNISNCQGRCEGCHSPHLRDDVGEDLEAALPSFLEKYKGRITCVCFMGEGNDPEALFRCLVLVKQAELKTCIYSGDDDAIGKYLLMAGLVDYLKFGHYDAEHGALNNPNTNQHMVQFIKGENTRYGTGFTCYDVTHKFWRNPLNDEPEELPFTDDEEDEPWDDDDEQE